MHLDQHEGRLKFQEIQLVRFEKHTYKHIVHTYHKISPACQAALWEFGLMNSVHLKSWPTMTVTVCASTSSAEDILIHQMTSELFPALK